MTLLLVSVSLLDLVLDVDIMHTRAPVTSGDDSGIMGGSPKNDPRTDDGLNWPGPYSSTVREHLRMYLHRVELHRFLLGVASHYALVGLQ